MRSPFNAPLLAAQPQPLSPVPLYEVMPGTERERFAFVPQTQADGTTLMVKATVKTATFRLAPSCNRYWTQRAKRTAARIRHSKGTVQ